MNDPKKSSRERGSGSDNLYQLFLKNLYESGFLKRKNQGKGLIMSALEEQAGTFIDFEPNMPKMLRMRYLVEDYEEFEKSVTRERV